MWDPIQKISKAKRAKGGVAQVAKQLWNPELNPSTANPHQAPIKQRTPKFKMYLYFVKN
jgi:hypothetical protein